MMSSQQRSMTIALWALLVLVMAGVIGAGVWSRFHDDGKPDAQAKPTESKPARPLPELWPAPAFSLTNQDGKTVTNQDLLGHVYVADFIFTNCAGPCRPMTAKMVQLQKQITDPNVRFLSFSVDPERDTPAVLSAYAKEFEADPNRWSFLTGDTAAMNEIAKGMKIAAEKQADLSVMHATYFLLVDGAGQVRGIYSTQGTDADGQYQQLIEDARKLASETPKAGPTAGGRPS